MSWAGAALRESDIVEESESKAQSVSIDDLVRQHAQTVFRVAYSLVRNHADAEDVVQETFLRAMKHGRLDGIDNYKAWLGKIAWRLALDRAKRIPAEPLEPMLETLRYAERSLEDALEQQQRSDLLRELLQTLPSDLREVTVLSTVEEMTSGDVAAVLGIPEGSVRTRLMRARQMLKQKLQAKLERK
jgi:RNA polymerase sigma-70 factor (ECF subfamily)